VCGICGVIQITGAPRRVVAAETLDSMTEAMAHRGPNDSGMYTAPGIALGARRLSIVDVDGGHQPFSNEDGTVWCVQNGELYNHDDLRDRLTEDGHRFSSRCDTEVIPHLYERRAVTFPEYLRGKFAIAVWDEAHRRAVLARDRLGVKPLYFAPRGDLLVFASELKSLLASGLVGDELDYEAIDLYLTFGFFPAPRTPLAGVSKLAPGHRLVVERGVVRIERYWAHPEPAPDVPPLTVDEYGEGLIEELERSVRLRLMSDVPLGAMLSGGLDSSLIVALMARSMSQPVKTFSIGFAEDGRLNELGDARRVAKLFGTEHHELELSLADQRIELEELAWSLDEPVAELSALGFLALSELASRDVTVALSGQGADELLGGYRKHRAASLAAAWNRLPEPARSLGDAVALQGPFRSTRAARVLAARHPADRFLAMSGVLGGELRARLVRGPLAAVEGNPARDAVLALLGDVNADPLSTTLYLDAQLALVDNMLHYFDRTSMAHSLEVRVPFLDHHVVEYCARVPANLKVRRLRTKYLLKHAARDILPERVIHKRKVGFFRGSARAWLGAQLDSAIPNYLLDPDARYTEMLERTTVEELLQAHRDGRGNPQLLLAILMLEVWLSHYLPRALGRTAQPAKIAV
jgi:asparagine synthase (glutamine-hydrolysing)